MTVLNAFENNVIITKGSNTLKDPQYKETWANELKKRAKQNADSENTDIGWLIIIIIIIILY